MKTSLYCTSRSSFQTGIAVTLGALAIVTGSFLVRGGYVIADHDGSSGGGSSGGPQCYDASGNSIPMSETWDQKNMSLIEWGCYKADGSYDQMPEGSGGSEFYECPYVAIWKDSKKVVDGMNCTSERCSYPDGSYCIYVSSSGGGDYSGTSGGSYGGGSEICTNWRSELYSPKAGKIVGYENCDQNGNCTKYDESGVEVGSCSSGGDGGSTTAPSNNSEGMKSCFYSNATKDGKGVGYTVWCESDYVNCHEGSPDAAQISDADMGNISLGAPSYCESGWDNSSGGGGSGGGNTCMPGIPGYDDAYPQGSSNCTAWESSSGTSGGSSTGGDVKPPETQKCYKNDKTGDVWWGVSATDSISMPKSFCRDLGVNPGQRITRAQTCLREYQPTMDEWWLYLGFERDPGYGTSKIEDMPIDYCTELGLTEAGSKNITEDMKTAGPIAGASCDPQTNNQKVSVEGKICWCGSTLTWECQMIRASCGNYICEDGEANACTQCYPGHNDYPACTKECPLGTCPSDCTDGGGYCGNGICEGKESVPEYTCKKPPCPSNPSYCPTDCGEFGNSSCGDGMCNGNEAMYCPTYDSSNGSNPSAMSPMYECVSCPEDCGKMTGGFCGDGACNGFEQDYCPPCYGESCAMVECMSCPSDCKSSGGSCGNNICEPGEDSSCPPCYPGAPSYPECMAMDCMAGTCPADCSGGDVCGNYICEGSENRESCPVDCGREGPATCGNRVCEFGEDTYCPEPPPCNSEFCPVYDMMCSFGTCPEDCGFQGQMRNCTYTSATKNGRTVMAYCEGDYYNCIDIATGKPLSNDGLSLGPPSSCDSGGNGYCGDGICESGEGVDPAAYCAYGPCPVMCPEDCGHGGPGNNLEDMKRDAKRDMRGFEREAKDMEREMNRVGLSGESKVAQLIKEFKNSSEIAVRCIDDAPNMREIEFCRETAYRMFDDIRDDIWQRMSAGNIRQEIEDWKRQVKDMDREIERFTRKGIKTKDLNSTVSRIREIIANIEEAILSDALEAERLREDVWGLQTTFWDTVSTLHFVEQVKDFEKNADKECKEFEREAKRFDRENKGTNSTVDSLKDLAKECKELVKEARADLKKEEDSLYVMEDFRWNMDDLWDKFSRIMDTVWRAQACRDAANGLNDAGNAMETEAQEILEDARQSNPEIASQMEKLIKKGKDLLAKGRKAVSEKRCEDAFDLVDKLHFDLADEFFALARKAGVVRDFGRGMDFIDLDRSYDEIFDRISEEGTDRDRKDFVDNLEGRKYGVKAINIIKQVAAEVIKEYFDNISDTDGPDLISSTANLGLQSSEVQELVKAKNTLLKEISELREEVATLQTEMQDVVNEVKAFTFGPKTAEKAQEFVKNVLPNLTKEEAETRLLALKEEGNEELYKDNVIPFVDTAVSDWYTQHAAQARRLGIIEGTGESGGKKLEPGRETNIAEAITMIARTLPDGIDENAIPTSRLGSAQPEWAKGAAGTLENAGVELDRVTTKSPDQAISRTEVAKLVTLSHSIPNADVIPDDIYGDVSHLSAEEKAAIASMRSSGIMQGDTPPTPGELTTFRPDAHLNRAELTTVLNRVIDNLDLTLGGSPRTRAAAPTQGMDAASDGSSVTVYVIALEDGGKNGRVIGCEDSTVGMKSTSSETSLTATLYSLFSLPSAFLPDGTSCRQDPDACEARQDEVWINALEQSSLTIEKASVEDGFADVVLKGDLVSNGLCDDPRVEEPLVETILRFPDVDSAMITINEESLQQFFDRSGKETRTIYTDADIER